VKSEKWFHLVRHCGLKAQHIPAWDNALRYDGRHKLQTCASEELYFSIEEGLKQAKQGKIKPMRESIKSIRDNKTVKN